MTVSALALALALALAEAVSLADGGSTMVVRR